MRSREPQLSGQSWVQIPAIERSTGLRECRLEAADVANTGGPAALIDQCLVEVDDFAERKVAHQASRRYSSWFFLRMRSAAARNSASGVLSRSASAARAKSSGASPRRLASSRSFSACAGGSSKANFMQVL